MPVNAAEIMSDPTNTITIIYHNKYPNIINIPVDVRDNQANYTRSSSNRRSYSSSSGNGSSSTSTARHNPKAVKA